jgi:protein involved in polysaccharide export with SLBB domain
MARPGRIVVTVLASSLLLGACATTQTIPQVTELPAVTKTGVQPGDQIVIAFYTAAGTELAEVSGERTVDDNGELFLPFLGTVPVLGLDAEAVRELLRTRYGTLYSDPVVEVIANVNINVTGAVMNPGRYFVPPSATLVDALSRAGGASSEVDLGLQGGASDPAQVRLVRDGVATVIDMRPLSVQPHVLSLRIQSGDWLHVPRATRSKVKENVSFYGTILSTLLTFVTLIILIGEN